MQSSNRRQQLGGSCGSELQGDRREDQGMGRRRGVSGPKGLQDVRCVQALRSGLRSHPQPRPRLPGKALQGFEDHYPQIAEAEQLVP